MLLSALLVLLGLVGLLVGGHLLVTGASGLAARSGISPLVVGLTVVAFGTSAPELAVNLAAALGGNPGLGFGNVVGSNLANIGLILGLAALVKPLVTRGTLIRREMPLLLLATVLVAVLVADGPLRGELGVIDRSDGVVLLLLFAVFLYAMAGDVFQSRDRDPQLSQVEHLVQAQAHPQRALGLDVLATVGGLALLVVGGRFTVQGATALAQGFGVSEVVIGLTIVAVGTSLPELVTTLIAVRRGDSDLALGNVVGSNLFNLLFVLGITATVAPVPLPEGGAIDIAMLLGLTGLMLALGLTHQRRFVRWEGGLLLLLWVGYSAWRSLSDALPAT